MAATHAPYFQSLYMITVDNFPNIRVVETSDRDTVSNAMALLALNNISSIPVFSDSKNEYVGYVDTKDIVQFLAGNYDSCDSSEKHASSFMQFCNAMTSMKFNSSTSSIVDISHTNEFHSLPPGSSIMNVLQVMKRTHCSRVPIVDSETSRIIKIISQSDLVHLLAHYASIEADPIKFNSSVEELNLLMASGGHKSSSTRTKKELIKLYTSQTAFEAIKMMADHKLSSLPVVNSDGELVTALSDNDIRLASAGYFGCVEEEEKMGSSPSSQLFSLFSLPIIEFIRKVREAKTQKTKHFFQTAVRIFPTDKLSTVLEKISSTGLHRLYITSSESDFTLRGVVSLVDILEILIA